MGHNLIDTEIQRLMSDMKSIADIFENNNCGEGNRYKKLKTEIILLYICLSGMRRSFHEY